MPPFTSSLKLKVFVVFIVGYCFENDVVAENRCALVRAQQAASSRLGWCVLVRAKAGCA
jgi:hypothetical protein